MTTKIVSQNTAKVNEINEISLNFIEKDGQILFTAEEIGKQLGYRKPSNSIRTIYSRNQKELDAYSVCIKLMQADGKSYQVRHFTEEGVYIISMLANTPKAVGFRAKFASLLREIRQNHITLATECAYNQGISYARSFPALEAETKQAYLTGLQEGKRLQKRCDGLIGIERALKYMGKGLNVTDAAKLIDMPPRTLSGRLARLRKNLKK